MSLSMFFVRALLSHLEDQIDHLADVLHRNSLAHGDLEVELVLNGNDQVDVLKGIPLRNIIRDRGIIDLDGIIVKTSRNT